MTLPEAIDKALHMREAAMRSGKCPKPSHDNFQGAMGRLREWRNSHPVPCKQTTERFMFGPLWGDLLHVMPGNKQGYGIITKLIGDHG